MTPRTADAEMGLDKRGWKSKFSTNCEWSLKDMLG
jgi:hypothetical protein